MSSAAPFVFVHGAWHTSRSWDSVVQLMTADGHDCRALTLPAADCVDGGQQCCQDDRAEFVVAAVRAAARGRRSVILVGHSLGGVTVSQVVEAVPQLIRAVVYLAAFMLPPRMLQAELMVHPSMAGSKVVEILRGHPLSTGELRLALHDPYRREALRAALYGDVEPAVVEDFIATLREVELFGAGLTPSPITRRRFGQVPRHYIICEDDWSVRPASQRWMISAVDAAMPFPTRVHVLHSSHSPFLSQPDALTAVLRDIVDAPRSGLVPGGRENRD